MCAHATQSKRIHWWQFPDGRDFKRPDDTVDVANWFMACESCALGSNLDTEKIDVVQDGIWRDGEIVLSLSPSPSLLTTFGVLPFYTQRHSRKKRLSKR